MDFSGQQQVALEAVQKWLEAPKNRENQVFRLFGYAGTGKTTIIKHLLAPVIEDCCFAAYTGKAALVMQKQGLPGASTLHSLIYRFIPPNAQAVANLKKEAATATGEMQAELKKKLREANQPRFVLNEESPLYKAELLGLDECSMVGPDLGTDVLSFGRPVLVLGDPGQLPPIEGSGFFVSKSPDVMLTEIHRQAEGNPIIQLATAARRGFTLALGEHGESVVKRDVTNDDLLGVDQVITGRNTTRMKLNQKMRGLQGFSTPYPSVGERLICLRNNREHGLLNGLQAKVLDIGDITSTTLELRIETELGREQTVRALTAHFDEYHTPGTVKGLSFYDKKRGDEFDFGYAITVHKSQGSQWDNVLLYDDKFFSWDKTMRAKWLYTAITRAAKRLMVIKL